MADFYHATTIENAINIFNSRKFYLSKLYGDEEGPIGFFATQQWWAGAEWGYQLTYEQDRDTPPVLLRIYISDDIIDEVMSDPVALQRNTESYFVSIKKNAIHQDEEGFYLPIDGQNLFIDLYSPVNEKELLGEIEQQLLWNAQGGWFSSDIDYDAFYEEEEDELSPMRRILDDEDYRKEVARKLFEEKIEQWNQLVNSWNAYIGKVRPTQELVGNNVNIDEEFTPIRVTYLPSTETDRQEEEEETLSGKQPSQDSEEESYHDDEEFDTNNKEENTQNPTLHARHLRKTLHLIANLLEDLK